MNNIEYYIILSILWLIYLIYFLVCVHLFYKEKYGVQIKRLKSDFNGKKIKFPKHECELTLTHNENRIYYQTVRKYLEEMEERESGNNFKNSEQRQKAIDTNEIWTLQWYPSTPVGFCSVSAPTLEELLESANEDEEY